jgi:hypothetical protein
LIHGQGRSHWLASVIQGHEVVINTQMTLRGSGMLAIDPQESVLGCPGL